MNATLCAWIVTSLASSALAGLPDERPPRNNPADLPLSSTLYDVWLARDLPLERLRDRAVRGFIDVDDARFVEIELVGPRGEQAVPDELVRRFGGVPGARYRHHLDARVPLSRLVDLARALPAGHLARTPIRPELLDVTGEGPAVSGSAEWRDGGANGAGKTVAIIDADFAGLDMAVQNGDLGAWHATNYTGTPLQDSDPHGTACAETVYDHAPGATYRLYKIASQAQLGNAVADCISNGVDVISHSLGYYGDWWFDDEGLGADAMRDAADAGILVFTAAGNSAAAHWEGTFSSYSGGSGWHGWSPGDRFLRIRVPAGATVRLYLNWDDSASGWDDYDLFLYDLAGSTALASSTNPYQFFEQLAWKNPDEDQDVQVNVCVWRASGVGATFELFANDEARDWEHVVAASSTGSPSNCTHANVVSVGAVAHDDYGSPAGATGIATSYTSLGPTNGGKIRPHVVAPTATTSFVYGGAFHGTSCSAPNAAGLALCLWSSVPNYHPNAIRWLVVRQGSVFRDWGAPGLDNTYGHGGVHLIDFAPGTRWLTTEYSNSNGYSTHPANTLQHALQQTPSGGRIVAFPGGAYPATITVTQPVTLVSRGASASFAD